MKYSGEDIKIVFFIMLTVIILACFLGVIFLAVIGGITNNNFSHEIGEKVQYIMDNGERLNNQNIILDGETIVLILESNNQFTYSDITNYLPDKIQPKRNSFRTIENPIHYAIVISDIKEVKLGSYKVVSSNAVVSGYGYEVTLTIVDLDQNKVLTIHKIKPTIPSSVYVNQPQDFYQSYNSDVLVYIRTIV